MFKLSNYAIETFNFIEQKKTFNPTILTSQDADGEGVAPGVQGEGGPQLVPFETRRNFHSGPSLITWVTSFVRNSTKL